MNTKTTPESMPVGMPPIPAENSNNKKKGIAVAGAAGVAAAAIAGGISMVEPDSETDENVFEDAVAGEPEVDAADAAAAPAAAPRAGRHGETDAEHGDGEEIEVSVEGVEDNTDEVNVDEIEAEIEGVDTEEMVDDIIVETPENIDGLPDISEPAEPDVDVTSMTDDIIVDDM